MKQVLAVIFIATTLFACTKDGASTNGGSTTNGGNTFTWVDNSITYNCDSAYASTQYKTIFVFKGATTTRYFFEVNLTSLAVANYTFGGSNALSYIRPTSAQLLTASAGSLAITANANSKISGAGTATIAASERVTFTFTDLPVRP